jgi:methionine synthase II (cobalamin-independent)
VGALPAGAATGVGSLPGADIDGAVALVFDELADLPHLPELPARGPESGLVGRTATNLVDLHVDLQPSGWRLVDRPGLDERRGVERLAADLDAVVPVAAGYAGPFKVQLAGPWTLAATVELPRGGAALGDRGAVRDLGASLAEAVATHLAGVRGRLPDAQLVLQLDEPALPAVLSGTVPTESGYGRHRPVDPADARAALAEAVAAAGEVPVVVHCCAADVPVSLLHQAGAAAVSFDLAAARLDPDEVGEAVERGLALWPGVLPARGPGVPPDLRSVLSPVRDLARRVGLAPDRVAALVLTPACGLAGASDGWVRTALGLLRRAVRALAEAPEEALR